MMDAAHAHMHSIAATDSTKERSCKSFMERSNSVDYMNQHGDELALHAQSETNEPERSDRKYVVKSKQAFAPILPSLKRDRNVNVTTSTSDDSDVASKKKAMKELGSCERGIAKKTSANDNSFDKLVVTVESCADDTELADTGPSSQSKCGLGPKLSYFLLFFSTFTIHAAMFNFLQEFRKLFGVLEKNAAVLLLFCWLLNGFAGFCGSIAGGAVKSRSLLLRRAVPVYWMGVFGLHVASFRFFSFVQSLLSSCSLLMCCGAHGILSGNLLLVQNDQSREPMLEDIVDKDSSTSINESQASQSVLRHDNAIRCMSASFAASCIAQIVFFGVMSLDGNLEARPMPLRVTFLTMLVSSFVLLSLLAVFWHRTRTGIEIDESESFGPSIGWMELRTIYQKSLTVVILIVAGSLVLAGSMLILLAAAKQSKMLVLVSGIMLVCGWFIALAAANFFVESRPDVLQRCQDLGVEAKLPALLLVTIVFACVGVLSTFIRAQFYVSLLVQGCQTDISLSFVKSSFSPALFGPFSGLVSLVTQWVTLTPRKICIRSRNASQQGNSSASALIDSSVLLFLIGLFSSSVLELYRRNSSVLEGELDGICRKSVSDFSVLWTLPHLLILGVADAKFRLGFLSQLFSLVQQTRMANAIQALWFLVDTVGNAAALAQASMLASWLYRAEPSDLTLLLLVATVVVALAYSFLRRSIEKYQHISK